MFYIGANGHETIESLLATTQSHMGNYVDVLGDVYYNVRTVLHAIFKRGARGQSGGGGGVGGGHQWERKV